MAEYYKYRIMSGSSGLNGILIVACIAFVIIAGCASGTLPATPAVPAADTQPVSPVATPAVTEPVVTKTAALPVTLPVLTRAITPGATQAGLDDCVSDAECVPAGCCQLDRCINRAWKQSCSGVMCLAVVDPNPRHCGCVNRVCTVQTGTGS